MNNIEQKVVEINLQILELERYCKYTKDPETLDSIAKDIEVLLVKRDIWLSFLS